MAIDPARLDLVRDSFRRIRGNLQPPSAMFYDALFLHAPGLRGLFRDDLEGQGMRFMTTLAVIVDDLDRPEVLEPQLAAIGRTEAVRTMLALGWPREVKTAWQATALNLAIFAGDAVMTRLLLENLPETIPGQAVDLACGNGVVGATLALRHPERPPSFRKPRRSLPPCRLRQAAWKSCGPSCWPSSPAARAQLPVRPGWPAAALEAPSSVRN